jgi:hypothetical protein
VQLEPAIPTATSVARAAAASTGCSAASCTAAATRLDLVRGELVLGYEEVTHRGCQVQQRARAGGGKRHARGTQQVQVLVDRREGQRQQPRRVLRVLGGRGRDERGVGLGARTLQQLLGRESGRGELAREREG